MGGLSGDALVERAEGIQSKEDFTAFLQLLAQNFRDHPEEWENNTLDQYLQGICGFADGIEGYFSNVGVGIDTKKPGWRVFADILLAGRIYE
jgi:hypothetical protein